MVLSNIIERWRRYDVNDAVSKLIGKRAIVSCFNSSRRTRLFRQIMDEKQCTYK